MPATRKTETGCMKESPRKNNKMALPALFLDRDGVINEDYGYVYKPSDLKLIPDIDKILRYFKRLQYWLIVITNQSGVARGYYTLQDVDKFHLAIQNKLEGIQSPKIDKFYICPHHVEGVIPEYAIKCDCRKPGIKNVLQAVQDFNIDFKKSVFIGDKPSDMECAKAAGIRPIFFDPKHSQRDLEYEAVTNHSELLAKFS